MLTTKYIGRKFQVSRPVIITVNVSHGQTLGSISQATAGVHNSSHKHHYFLLGLLCLLYGTIPSAQPTTVSMHRSQAWPDSNFEDPASTLTVLFQVRLYQQ